MCPAHAGFHIAGPNLIEVSNCHILEERILLFLLLSFLHQPPFFCIPNFLLNCSQSPSSRRYVTTKKTCHMLTCTPLWVLSTFSTILQRPSLITQIQYCQAFPHCCSCIRPQLDRKSTKVHTSPNFPPSWPHSCHRLAQWADPIMRQFNLISLDMRVHGRTVGRLGSGPIDIAEDVRHFMVR